MTIVYKPKKSTTTGVVPTTSDLVDGELGANTADKKFFIRVGGSVVDMTPAGSSGTVTSVGAIGSTGLSVSGSPITTSGSITYTLSANLQSWSGIAPSSKADLASPAFTGSVTVAGGITASGYIGGSLSHVIGGGYMTIGSYNTASYGSGSCRMWWNENSKLLTVDDAVRVSLPSGGVSMGAGTASSPTDVYRHLALYGASYGLSVTGYRLNYVAPTSAAHKFIVNGADIASIDATNGLVVGGSISDTQGDVRRTPAVTSNASVTVASTALNGILEKTNTTAYNYTISTTLGAAATRGDMITFVNSGTAGNITVVQGASTTIVKNGVSGSFTVGPGSMATIVYSATANKWIAG